MEKNDIFSAGEHLKRCLSVAAHDPFFILKIKAKIKYTQVKKTLMSILAKGYAADEDKKVKY
jgi:hypothetical protein